MSEDRKSKKALRANDRQLAEWTSEHDNCAQMLSTAREFAGTVDSGLVLKKGEAIFLSVTNTALIEDRRGPGHYSGRSQGLSFPIASIGGRSVRYRVGASRGHFIQGTPTPAAIDVGTTYITNQRVVFRGGKQTRECAFAKLIGYDHTDAGSTVFSVSNRQKPTVVHYGSEISHEFGFRLELALAHFRDDVPSLVAELEASLAEIDARKPAAPLPPPPSTEDIAALVAGRSAKVATDAHPSPVETVHSSSVDVRIESASDLVSATAKDSAHPAAAEPAPGPTTGEPLPPPGWFADPWGLAELRWWDGSAWTANTHPQVLGDRPS